MGPRHLVFHLPEHCSRFRSRLTMRLVLKVSKKGFSPQSYGGRTTGTSPAFHLGCRLLIDVATKYLHFLTDITTYKTSLNCFELTSTGFVSSRNVKTLHLLHKLMRMDLKKSVFMNNLNSLPH